MAARRLKSRLCSVCNPYVKISLVPDSEERTFCRTPLVRATNSPIFDQKFSFDFLAEDLDKRLLVSIWSRDTLRKRSEFLGCMSFSVAHISSKRVHGWFRLLTESLGRRKHFAVSFLNASHETTRTKMEEMVLLDDNTTTPATGGVAVDDNKQMAVGARPSTQPPRGQTPYTITINVVRGSQAFGFSVAWTKPPRVERVEEGLPAHQAGLKPGDYIIFIGQYNVVKYEEEAVLKIIRECGDTLPLEVYRRGVSKHPRGLVNGYTSLPAPTDNEAHTRKRLSHITFNTEKVTADRQHTIYSLINCEQAFSNSCRFGLERYLIPLKFRSDLVTQTQHDVLFNNLDQLMDLSETLVDRLMGNDDDNIGDQVGRAYYMLIEELSEHYRRYLGGLPEADKVLSQKLHDLDFKDFLQVPLVPCKKPDITTFIHKPAEVRVLGRKGGMRIISVVVMVCSDNPCGYGSVFG
nr:regulator of G-protein signaling 3-like [Procambarus clarkii]